MEYELQVEHDAAVETAREELKEKQRGRTIVGWRVSAVIMILAVIAMIIYFVVKGVVWGYDAIFGRRPINSTEQQIQGGGNGFENLGSSNASTQTPPPPPVSNFNVIPVPSSQNQNAQVPAQPLAPGSPSVQSPSAQINNPGGCPDYLGDRFACVPSPPNG